MSLLQSSSALRAHGSQNCGRNCSSTRSLRGQRVAFSGVSARRNVLVKAVDEVGANLLAYCFLAAVAQQQHCDALLVFSSEATAVNVAMQLPL